MQRRMVLYKEQLYDRQIYKYPPYFRMIKLTLKQRDFDKLKEGAMWLYQVMNQQNSDLYYLKKLQKKTNQFQLFLC